MISFVDILIILSFLPRYESFSRETIVCWVIVHLGRRREFQSHDSQRQGLSSSNSDKLDSVRIYKGELKLRRWLLVVITMKCKYSLRNIKPQEARDFITLVPARLVHLIEPKKFFVVFKLEADKGSLLGVGSLDFRRIRCLKLRLCTEFPNAT